MHELQRAGQRIRRHIAARSLDEALALLAEHGPGARLVAGGTDLLVELDRGVRPGVEVLVDLSRIPGLDRIEELDRGALRLGPLVTHNRVVDSALVVQRALPLAQACFEVGSPALRNRATIVGNLVTASPANDTISALWALDATVIARSVDGERRIPVRAFYPGIRRTALAPGELVAGIELPAPPPGQRGVFVKLGQRRAQAISVVHAAVVLTLEVDDHADAIVSTASITLGSVAPTVVSALEAETSLVGHRLATARIAEAAGLAAEGVTPIDDVRATAVYRSEEITVMVRRALTTLRDGTERARWPARPVFLWGAGKAAVSSSRATAVHDDDTPIRCTINGQPVDRAGGAGSNLLDWLRDEVGLTGTKEGCAEGECGACIVHLDGTAVLSCLVPAPRAAGAEITTVEGLAGGGPLAPIQQAFIDQFAVQCGFCIPGFLMSGDRLLQECPAPTRDDIALGLAGNLCRCTGYLRFYDALEQAAGPMSAR